MIRSLPVSVVLPTHNRAKLLPRAIDSVLCQTVGDLELIIVDDASSDDTAEVLSLFHDSRIRILRHQENFGAAAARNTGIRAARGELVAFQDSDDIWVPHKLQAQIDALAAMPDAAAAYCSLIRICPSGAVVIPGNEVAETSGRITATLLRTNCISTQTLIVQRSLLVKLDGFDETLPCIEDWDLVLRLSEHTPFAFVREPLALVHETAGSISSVPLNDSIARMRILEKLAPLFVGAPEDIARHYLTAGRNFLGHRYGKDAVLAFRSAVAADPARPTTWARLAKAIAAGLLRR